MSLKSLIKSGKRKAFVPLSTSGFPSRRQLQCLTIVEPQNCRAPPFEPIPKGYPRKRNTHSCCEHSQIVDHCHGSLCSFDFTLVQTFVTVRVPSLKWRLSTIAHMSQPQKSKGNEYPHKKRQTHESHTQNCLTTPQFKGYEL